MFLEVNSIRLPSRKEKKIRKQKKGNQQENKIDNDDDDAHTHIESFNIIFIIRKFSWLTLSFPSSTLGSCFHSTDFVFTRDLEFRLFRLNSFFFFFY